MTEHKPADEDENARRAKADEEAGQKLDKLLSHVDAAMTKLDSMGKRIDALEERAGKESRRVPPSPEQRVAEDVGLPPHEHAAKEPPDNDDEDFDDLPEDERERWLAQERDRAVAAGRTPFSAEQVAFDARQRFDETRKREDAGAKRRRLEARRADAQARADSVAQAHGLKAKPPMSGETLQAYRLRLLRDFQHHSPAYRNIDVAAITDPKLFRVAESQIYADAVAASLHPQAAAGTLRPITRKVGFQEITDWAGEPRAWMDEFAGPARQYVTNIRTPTTTAS